MFLFGPVTLWKNMTNPTRRTVTIVFFTAMLISVVTCMVLNNNLGKFITLISVGVQMASYWWYSLSYIPFGRKILATCCSCLYSGLDK